MKGQITKQNIGKRTGIETSCGSHEQLAIFKHTYAKLESVVILFKILLIFQANYNIYAGCVNVFMKVGK